jgi:hypothetical protein
VDPFKSYTEFGDKIRKKRSKTPRKSPTLKTASSNVDTKDVETAHAMTRKTPLPDIAANQNALQNGDQQGEVDADTDEARKGETGKTFTLTGVAGDIIEPFVEPEIKIDRREVMVSPVPTPLLFRPETRQAGRLSLREKRERLLEGDVTVPVNPSAKMLRVYLQSAFSGKANKYTNLSMTLNYAMKYL